MLSLLGDVEPGSSAGITGSGGSSDIYYRIKMNIIKIGKSRESIEMSATNARIKSFCYLIYQSKFANSYRLFLMTSGNLFYKRKTSA
jgi:hypothetical protein